MVVPEGGKESRTYRLSYGRMRALAGAGAFVAFLLTVMAGSWWYLAAKASKVSQLEAQLEERAADSLRIRELATQLQVIESQYEDIRSLFGSSLPDAPSEVWLPPPSGAGRRGGPVGRVPGDTPPDHWPLAVEGFITQGLMDAGPGEHPGLDIAVPTDSYIRASGGGVVVDVGEDEVYGRFVVLDHGDGYTSLYAHASLTLVLRGQRVRQKEVIALSGSTGRSTAPHLHFEVLLEGEAVDPLTMVTQP
jgi:murein DD-endopeptidase MepM/ murein hydrolase activator NlpD